MLMPWSTKLTTIEKKAEVILNRMIYTMSFSYFSDTVLKEAKSDRLQRLTQFHYNLLERCRVKGITSTREDVTLKSTFESLLAQLKET